MRTKNNSKWTKSSRRFILYNFCQNRGESRRSFCHVCKGTNESRWTEESRSRNRMNESMYILSSMQFQIIQNDKFKWGWLLKKISQDKCSCSLVRPMMEDCQTCFMYNLCWTPSTRVQIPARAPISKFFLFRYLFILTSIP